MKVFSSILLAVTLFVAALLCAFLFGVEAVPLQHTAHHQSRGRSKHAPCVKLNPASRGKSLIKSPLPKFTDSIPRVWDWRNISGTGMGAVTEQIDQHSGGSYLAVLAGDPNALSYCGSCYIASTTSALADRIKIRRLGASPDVRLSVQSIVYCVPDGCGGGDPIDVYAWIQSNPNNGWGIPDASCLQYAAEGTGKQCSPYNTCRYCAPGQSGLNCTTVTDYYRFGVEEYGAVTGIENMKAEIYERGPIQCSIDAGPIWDWGFNTSSRKNPLFTGGKGFTNIDHAIEVVGWGESVQEGRNIPYWIIKNSWGSFWGALGYFYLEMGQNQLGIETNPCAWATPILPPSYENPKYKDGWWKSL